MVGHGRILFSPSPVLKEPEIPGYRELRIIWSTVIWSTEQDLWLLIGHAVQLIWIFPAIGGSGRAITLRPGLAREI